MRTFFAWLQHKKSRKSTQSADKKLGSAHINKIMRHLKAYIKWLSDGAKLGKLVPGDVPNCTVKHKVIKWLSKQELSLLMLHLEATIEKALLTNDKHKIYSAYLWRAVVRMLYTS